MQQKDPMGRLCVVADDNAEVRAEICQRIRLSGMFERVKSFESLEGALCFIRHTEVDLFISDICFPDEELSFRRLSEIPTVPVMLISAYELYFIVHYLDIRENMNMIGLLHKPLTDDFEANVRASFSRYKGLGLDQSVVLERSRNEKLILCQGERQLKRYEVKYSEIVLVQACRKPRGLQVYIKAISTFLFDARATEAFLCDGGQGMSGAFLFCAAYLCRQLGQYSVARQLCGFERRWLHRPDKDSLY